MYTVEWGWNYRKYLKTMWKHPKEPRENQLFQTPEIRWTEIKNKISENGKYLKQVKKNSKQQCE